MYNALSFLLLEGQITLQLLWCNKLVVMLGLKLSSLTFFWDPVSYASRYQYNFKRDDGNEMSTNFTPYTNISFLGLSPCTSYSFSVKAFTSKTVSSMWTEMINQRTSKIGKKCSGTKEKKFS